MIGQRKAPPSPRHSSSGLVVPITISNFSLVLGYATITPTLPLYAAGLRLPATQIGVVVAAYGIARLALDLVGGVLGDRIGFRRVAVGGCVLVVAGALISAISESFATLLAGQVVAGIGSAVYTIAAFTAVILLADPHRKAAMMSRYHMAIIVAFSLGPLLGGFLGDWLGLRSPFVAFAVGAAVAGVLAALYVPQAVADSVVEDRPRLWWAMRQMLRSPAFVVSLMVIASGYMVRTGFRNTTVPIYATEMLAMSVSMVGILLTTAVLTNAVVLPHAGRSLDTFGRRPVTIYSSIGTTVVLVGFVFAGKLWQLFVLMGLLGVVSAYAGLAPVAVLADVIDARMPGISVGLQRMGVDLGMVVGPLVAGVGLQYFGFRETFLIFAALMAMVSVLSFIGPETVSRSLPKEPI